MAKTDKDGQEEDMIFLVPLALFFGLEVAYALLDDAGQSYWFIEASQWQAVALAWMLFLAVPYRLIFQKTAAAILIAYLLWIVGTDYLLEWFPPWGGILELIAFVAFGAWVIRNLYGSRKTY